MRYVFFGTPEFAAIILETLVQNDIPPLAVICNPDRPSGRKRVITPPPVKQSALRAEPPIAVLQPETIDAAFLKILEEYRPDFFVVAAYAKILPDKLINIPRLGTIGVHPSLLPKYRGATPIQAAILNGEKETGVALYSMDEKVDHGPVLAISTIRITDQNYELLSKQLAEAGGECLIRTLPGFIEKSITPRIQDEKQATYTKKFTAEDGFVAIEEVEAAERGRDSFRIWRKIRALNPEPGAYTRTKDGKRMKLLDASIVSEKLALTKIQFEGKRPESRLAPSPQHKEQSGDQ